MKRTLVLLIAAVAAGCASESERTAETFTPVANVREVMEAITIPSADRVWAAAAEPPTTDDGWQDAEHAGLALAESGNLLLMPGRAPEGDPEWTSRVNAMLRASAQAAGAARARDGQALFVTGEALYETCLACHQEYMHPLFNRP
jgi:hypothetical protein